MKRQQTRQMESFNKNPHAGGFIQDSFNASSNLSLDGLNMTKRDAWTYTPGEIPTINEEEGFKVYTVKQHHSRSSSDFATNLIHRQQAERPKDLLREEIQDI